MILTKGGFGIIVVFYCFYFIQTHMIRPIINNNFVKLIEDMMILQIN